MDKIEQRILDIIDANAERIIAFGDDIWHHAELSYMEHRTAKKFSDVMKELGMETREGIAVTGVKSYLKPREEGEVCLALIGEMDALPIPDHPDAWSETGAAHCCGHNAQITGVMGAALALADPVVKEALGGNISFIGMPSEEGSTPPELREQLMAEGKIHYKGGKCEFIHLGEFDDIDMAIGHHMAYGPHERTSVNSCSMGAVEKRVIFHGKSTHPSQIAVGADTQAAAALTMTAVHYARESFVKFLEWDQSKCMVHSMILNGGNAVNVVTDQTEMGFDIRALDMPKMEDLTYRVERCIKGACMATGCGAEIRTMPGYMPFSTLKDNSVVKEAIALLPPDDRYPVKEMGPQQARGTTDFADVSTIMPLLFFMTAGHNGKPAHSVELNVTDPMEYYVTPAKIFALTAYRLLKDNAARAKQIIRDNPPVLTPAQWRAAKEQQKKVETIEMQLVPDFKKKA